MLVWKVINSDTINVVIINHSPQVCQYLSETLKLTKQINVIAVFQTIIEGTEFLDSNQESKQTDVLLLDVSLIAANVIYRVPTILISNHPFKNTLKIVRAINRHLGVIDYVKLPHQYNLNNNKLEKAELIRKINKASKIDLSNNYKAIKQEEHLEVEPFIAAEEIPAQAQIDSDYIIGVGTSTGGPQALHILLQTIPEDFGPPIFIVQHMPSNFTKTLAERLNGLTKRHVKEAIHGEIVKSGTVYLAPGDYQMRVVDEQSKLRIKLTQEPKVSGHRPSVDVLFQSIAKLDRMSKIAIVLTGMGKDGAEGVKYIRQADKTSLTIAESSETAIIYGMPKAAIETGNIVDIIRLDELGERLINYVK